MSIMGDLRVAGIILPQQNTGKLGTDLNEDSKISNEELIPDSNGDGKIQTSEALEFIVNNVRNYYILQDVEQIMEKGDKDDPDVSAFFRPIWIKINDVKAEKVAEVEALQLEVDKYAVELAKIGLQPLLSQNIFCLPTGQKIVVENNVRSQTSSHSLSYNPIEREPAILLPEPFSSEVHASQIIHHLDGRNIEMVFDEPQEVPVAVGQTIFAKAVTLEYDGRVSSMRMSEPQVIVTPKGDSYSAIKLRFDKEGDLNRIYFSHPQKVDFLGQKVDVYVISINKEGDIVENLIPVSEVSFDLNNGVSISVINIDISDGRKEIDFLLSAESSRFLSDGSTSYVQNVIVDRELNVIQVVSDED